VDRGGATVLKVGDNFASGRSEQKIFLDPPLFGQWGAKYCLDSVAKLLDKPDDKV